MAELEGLEGSLSRAGRLVNAPEGLGVARALRDLACALEIKDAAADAAAGGDDVDHGTFPAAPPTVGGRAAGDLRQAQARSGTRPGPGLGSSPMRPGPGLRDLGRH